MSGIKLWADERPDVGRHFVAYGRWDDEPTLCTMTAEGPEQSTFNMTIEHGPWATGGATLEPEMDFKYGAMWCYVPDAPTEAEWLATEKDGGS